MLNRLLRVTGYSALARYRATLLRDGNPIGFIPRMVGSPYSSGPSHCVFLDPKRGRVIIVETAHRRYDIYGGIEQVFDTDDAATAAYMETRNA